MHKNEPKIKNGMSTRCYNATRLCFVLSQYPAIDCANVATPTRFALSKDLFHSVGGGVGELGGGESDAGVGGIVHEVETLEPRQTVDEVETLAGGGAEVTDNQVDVTSLATDGRVELQYDISINKFTSAMPEYLPNGARPEHWQ